MTAVKDSKKRDFRSFKTYSKEKYINFQVHISRMGDTIVC